MHIEAKPNLIDMYTPYLFPYMLVSLMNYCHYVNLADICCNFSLTPPLCGLRFFYKIKFVFCSVLFCSGNVL